jgi:hypothetical protein
VTTPDHDARVQRATLLLLHHLHPMIPTREELHRQLLDGSTSDDDAQRAIDDLASLHAIEINPSDQTVRLPLAVLTVLELMER